MSHTCSAQFIHVLFTTKNLTPYFTKESIDSLGAYTSGIIKNIGGQCIASGGTENHFHLLLNLPTHASISEFVQKIKSNTSKWYSQLSPHNFNFEWNKGYLAFSVSPTSISSVKTYFSVESSRHATKSVEQEMEFFLRVQEIDFKKQFLTSTTYSRIIYHLVWSVKNRMPLLIKSVQSILHENIRLDTEKLNAQLYAIGNVNDHIHLLVECPTTLATSDLVNKLKVNSTYILRKQNKNLEGFCWQEGFGVFSVGKPVLEACKAYVNNQEEHHSHHSYDDEWKRLLCNTL